MRACADPARAVRVGDPAHFERIFGPFRPIIEAGKKVAVDVDERDHVNRPGVILTRIP
jgi:hypothetical protein